MADYDKRFSLEQAPEAHIDGSGMVRHEIVAVYRESGTDDPWQPIPGRSKTINIPAAALQEVLDMDMPNGEERVTAYKQVLVDSLNTQNVPITGWGVGALETLLDMNDQAQAAATAANEYITVTLGQSYPVRFSL